MVIEMAKKDKWGAPRRIYYSTWERKMIEKYGPKWYLVKNRKDLPPGQLVGTAVLISRRRKKPVRKKPPKEGVKYPVSERGSSYQRYLAKLRRRAAWKRRTRR